VAYINVSNSCDKKSNKEGNANISYRSFCDKNLNTFSALLTNKDWTWLYDSINKKVHPNELFDKFHSTFLDDFNKAFPCKTNHKTVIKQKIEQL
jgi:hypothetical protein